MFIECTHMCIHLYICSYVYAQLNLCVVSLAVVKWKICPCDQLVYVVCYSNSPQVYMLGQVPTEGDTEGNDADLQVRHVHM